MKDLKLNLDLQENITAQVLYFLFFFTAPKPNHMGFLYENWSH